MPPTAPGGEFAPTITTWPWTKGTELYGVTISTSPSLPNVGTGPPDFASTATSRRPAVKMMRGGCAASPGQTATPRRDTPVTAYCQISFPVSGSSATMRLAAGTYITPPTTIGVASEASGRPPASGACRWYDHAGASVATFLALSCVSGERPVPAASWRNIGQS